MTSSIKKYKTLAIALILNLAVLVAVAILTDLTPAVTAEASEAETTETVAAASDPTGDKAMAAGIAIGLAAAGGAVAMGIAIGKAEESIARQPEVKGDVRTTLMLGLVFIETAIIYALIVAILVVFVL